MASNEDQRKWKFTVGASIFKKTKDLLDEAQDTALGLGMCAYSSALSEGGGIIFSPNPGGVQEGTLLRLQVSSGPEQEAGGSGVSVIEFRSCPGAASGEVNLRSLFTLTGGRKEKQFFLHRRKKIHA